MADYILVRRERIEALEASVNNLRTLLEQMMQETGTATLPDSEPPERPSGHIVDRTPPADTVRRNGKYKIGRTEQTHSYADVVWREFKMPEFPLDEAWEAVKDIIDTDAKRPRDSFRQSLNNDERFRKVKRSDGIWYQRVDMEQMAFEGSPRESGSQR